MPEQPETFSRRRRTPALAAVLAALAGASAACGDARPIGSAAPGADLLTWRLADAPTASIGTVEGDERFELVEVTSAWQQADGTIVVVDAGRAALIFYDAAGRYLRESGGRGSGPGEFGRMIVGWPYRGDSIAVFDFGQRRLSVFDAAGAFGRSFVNPVRYDRLPGTIPSQSCCAIRGSFDDGSFVGVPPDHIPVEPGPDRFASATLMRVAADGSSQDTLGIFEAGLYRYDSSAPSRVWNHDGSYAFHYAVAGDALVGGNGLGDTLIVVSRAGTSRTIRLPGDAVPYTRELQLLREQAIREDYAARGERAYHGDVESNLPRAYPPNLPRHVGIRADAAGRLWLERWTPRYGHAGAPAEYHVLDPDGELIATLMLPPGARLLWPGEDSVLLLERDSLDVQYVRSYPLLGPGDPSRGRR
jgi:hypothetical protein